RRAPSRRGFCRAPPSAPSVFHPERKHLRRTSTESRRYRNAIREVKVGARQGHEPDLDRIAVRRHVFDAPIVWPKTRHGDKFYPAHRCKARVAIRCFVFNSNLLLRFEHEVKPKLAVEHRYGLIAYP